MFYVISKETGKMLEYEGEIRFNIKKAIHLTSLVREYNGENRIIVNCETGTQYSYLEIVKWDNIGKHIGHDFIYHMVKVQVIMSGHQ